MLKAKTSRGRTSSKSEKYHFSLCALFLFPFFNNSQQLTRRRSKLANDSLLSSHSNALILELVGLARRRPKLNAVLSLDLSFPAKCDIIILSIGISCFYQVYYDKARLLTGFIFLPSGSLSRQRAQFWTGCSLLSITLRCAGLSTVNVLFIVS